ncbi:DUF721 domain-containing protein [Aureimonas fodinaquatilis]|uniref:DUF721 domain-containing protein n=1 Tax=Aureimonas fodinaquatilis TaxID=2565783 RepID=A0A5B0E2F7_9HYPH|nr:DciA family protein [Aureimonas fodinaquatilis]KAA0972502.1 DUF721 domain-containing protein [Aureimonas fodinaquatilis]
MARPQAPKGARQVGELVANLVDPVLARKAGISISLLSAWPEIAGARLAEATRPERLVWNTKPYDDAPFEPATLIVACEGAFVLRLQHESNELVQRINAAFGYHAVNRVKIVQKPVHITPPNRKLKMRPLNAQDHDFIQQATQSIENPRLKAALERYGETILGRNQPKK